VPAVVFAVVLAAVAFVPVPFSAQAPAVQPPAPASAAEAPAGGQGGGRGGRGPALPQVPAWEAQPRTDQNSRLAHEQLLAKRTQGKIDIYFAGDSIVRRWGATDYPQFLENWKANLWGWNAANFGWGADRIQNILWRLENGELDGIHPKVIVLLAGTNNVGNQPGNDAKVDEISRGLKAVVDLMREKAPDATIIVTGIFPRGTNIEVFRTIERINANVSKFADGQKVRYLNVNAKLADPNGVLVEGVMNADRLHPALGGYQIWADALKPIFTELLGPPASTDSAPPPTGDPSAAGRGTGPAPTPAPQNAPGLQTPTPQPSPRR
jgi:lysophospholipase L1-like esterase